MNEYIIRERIELNFTQVPKTALKDRNLSLKAKGLYAYLFSLPEDWKVFKTEIITNSNDGRDSFNTAFKELEEFGYLESRRVRDPETKQYVGTSILLRIEPNGATAGKPTVANPTVGKPTRGKPATTNTNITNTDSTNILFEENNIVGVFISEFQKLTGRKFRMVGKALQQFKARIKDGYTYNDILQATKNAMQEQYHRDNNFNNLTPEFITRTDKLEKYLNYKCKVTPLNNESSTISM